MTIFTSQGHISKLILLSQTSKCCVDIFLEVIPLQAELFRHVESSRKNTLMVVSKCGLQRMFGEFWEIINHLCKNPKYPCDISRKLVGPE